MSIGVIGRKVGMTSIFAEDGTMVPVSVVEVEPNTVTALRTTENDGYTAVQLGAGTAKKLTKPRAGQLKGLPPVKHTREFRLDDISDYTIGQTLDVSLFADGEEVDVTGVSKGKGFSGTIKRHGFRRGPETHGSDSHRQPGSIGAGTYPGKVFKGTPHGRPHGQRPRHRQEADHRAQRCGAQPAADQGLAARRAQRAWSSIRKAK